MDAAALQRECESIRVTDPWLAEEVEKHIRRGSIYEYAVGAGLIARYRTPPTRKKRQKTFEQLLRGELPPKLMQDRAWAKQLSSEELDRLASLAFEGATMLLEDVLQFAFGTESADWQTQLARIVIARDDLQGVFLLLHHVRPHERLERLLRTVDEEGEVVLKSANQFRVDNEQLHRAVMGCPEGWWTIPGRA